MKQTYIAHLSMVTIKTVTSVCDVQVNNKLYIWQKSTNIIL